VSNTKFKPPFIVVNRLVISIETSKEILILKWINRR